MLFIQKITIEYTKDVRYPDYAQQRQAIRFYPVDLSRKPSGGAVFFTERRYYQTKETMLQFQKHYRTFKDTFFEEGIQDFTEFAVQKTDHQYHILFHPNPNSRKYEEQFALSDGEYGRILCNERGIYWDCGTWYYELITYNLLACRPEQYREKLFYRKVPDYAYDARKYLYYSG